MALNVSELQNKLEILFAAPPSTFSGCAQAWADAFVSYVSSITPAVVPGTAEAAGTILSSSLASLFASSVNASTTGSSFMTALQTFATAVGAGMAPGFVATPPVGASLNLAAALLGPFPTTHAEAAQNYSELFHSWFVTGTAVPVPPGPVVNWS